MPAHIIMKILIVLTSHSELGDTGKKTGFWVEEFAAPYYELADAGAETNKGSTMLMLISVGLPIAALGYSMVYLLFGGGIGGAIVIFIVAKIVGK